MTGAAWLSSACGVNRSVKSGNKRNPYCLLQVSDKTALVNREEGGDDAKSAWPLMPWATHMLQWPVQRVLPSREAELIPSKPVSVRIGVCNSTP